MPGLRGRFSTLVKAKTSAALDRAEDPTQTLDYSYEKQLELMANVKNGITEVATSRKRLQNQQESLREQVVKLDGQARQALGAGNEDLSRAALERKQAVQSEIGSIDAQVAALERQQEQLTDSQHKLQAKLDAFRTQKEVVKAQYSAAQAQVQMSEATTGVAAANASVRTMPKLSPDSEGAHRTSARASSASLRSSETLPSACTPRSSSIM